MTHLHIKQHSPWTNYYVSAKHDGMHCVLVTKGHKGYLVLNDQFKVIDVKDGIKELCIVEGEVL